MAAQKTSRAKLRRDRGIPLVWPGDLVRMSMENLANTIDRYRQKAIALPFPAIFPAHVPVNHLDYIHAVRCRLVRTLLPAAAEICDLGGANSPLYRMGYPYPFDRLVMIDLPDEQRHKIYGKFEPLEHDGNGKVQILYANMVHLDMLPDASFDLVWSGQSIEHISEADGRRMCAEVFRILKPNGAFCLDTPNGKMTRVHAATGGLPFIHPEHQIEYEPAHLKDVIRTAGFKIIEEYGICHMRTIARTGEFSYNDFRDGIPISSNVDESYIQYYSCRKSRTGR
jgi:predicted SAM-dependent methyltransferase